MTIEHQEKIPMGGKTPLLITKVTAQAWKQTHMKETSRVDLHGWKLKQHLEIL